MEKEFDDLLEKYKNDENFENSLLQICRSADRMLDEFEIERQTKKFHEDCRKKIKKFDVNVNIKNELEKIISMLKLDDDAYFDDGDHDRIQWSISYKLCDFEISKICTGSHGFSHEDITLNIDNNIIIDSKNNHDCGHDDYLDIEYLYKIYNNLNLKHMSVYYFFKILILFLNLLCDYEHYNKNYHVMKIPSSIIIKKEIAELKYKYIKSKIDAQIIEEYIPSHNSIFVQIDKNTFDIHKKFEDQNVTIKKIKYGEKNKYYYKQNDKIYKFKKEYSINTGYVSSSSEIKITDENKELFEVMFDDNY